MNAFLLSPLNTICLDVIRTDDGLGTVEKDTKDKTRIKNGVHNKNHVPITENPTHKLTLDSASSKNIDPYTNPNPATFADGIRSVEVEITRPGIDDEANRTDDEILEGENDRTAKNNANDDDALSNAAAEGKAFHRLKKYYYEGPSNSASCSAETGNNVQLRSVKDKYKRPTVQLTKHPAKLLLPETKRYEWWFVG